MGVLLASVQTVLYLVRDPLKAVIVILVLTATELAVCVPFTYRHARSPDEAKKQEAILLAEKREKVKRDLEEWKKRNGL